jgi:hypothetical protein
MPALISCAFGIGFIALAAILVIHVARDIESPSEGKRIHEALAHLEKTLQNQVTNNSAVHPTNRIVFREK